MRMNNPFDFSIESRGYSCGEVDEYIAVIQKERDTLLDRNQTLLNKLSSVRAVLRAIISGEVPFDAAGIDIMKNALLEIEENENPAESSAEEDGGNQSSDTADFDQALLENRTEKEGTPACMPIWEDMAGTPDQSALLGADCRPVVTPSGSIVDAINTLNQIIRSTADAAEDERLLRMLENAAEEDDDNDFRTVYDEKKQ